MDVQTAAHGPNEARKLKLCNLQKTVTGGPRPQISFSVQKSIKSFLFDIDLQKM